MTPIKKWDGKQISVPGIYSHIPLEIYHGQKILDGPSVSSSGLRLCFAKSPAHFYAQWSGNPDAVPEDPEPHHIIGRASHHLFLGEADFAKTFCCEPVVYPDAKTGQPKPWSNNSNFAKDWHSTQRARGLIVLTPNMIRQIRGMARTLQKNNIVRAGALNGMIEHSMFWRDKITGLWLKSRPDAIPTGSADFVDLKTTTSTLYQDLQRTIAECGYHAQGALVRSGARQLLGMTASTFTLVFIEKDEPHCVRVMSLQDEDLDRGEHQNRVTLDTIAECIRVGDWPGPGGNREDAEYIELPAWGRKQIDDKLQFGI